MNIKSFINNNLFVSLERVGHDLFLASHTERFKITEDEGKDALVLIAKKNNNEMPREWAEYHHCLNWEALTNSYQAVRHSRLQA